MEDFYLLFKAFTDPVLIIFILLLAALILSFSGSKKKSSILIMGLAVLILYGATVAPVANYLAYYLEKDYLRLPAPSARNIDVIVVLGGGVHDVHDLDNIFLSESSAARLLHGVEMFNKSQAKYFVCAGKGTSRMTEAEVMAHRALALGVPEDKIRIDANSNNTWEHAIELNKMFANKKINIGIVTSGYHMKRSEREFKKYFSNIVPLPASYSYSSPLKRNIRQYIPQTGALNTTAAALREIIGSIWYELKNI